MKKIIFERSGGFMGRKVSLALDLDELEPDQSQAILQMLEEADFFNMPEELLPQEMSDTFLYSISVKIKRQMHSVRFSDMTVPDTLRPLVEDLSEMARKQRGIPS